MIIGLAGVARSGKDTVGKILCDKHGFTRLAFADGVRQGMYDINPIIDIEDRAIRRLQNIVDDIGWDEAKTSYNEVRELLQRYGTEGGRLIHGEACWTDIVRKAIEENPSMNYVITDVRFENEVEVLKRLGGKVLQIQRKGFTPVNGHVSDKVLDEKLFDQVIKNNGTLKKLSDKVDTLVSNWSPVEYRVWPGKCAWAIDKRRKLVYT